MELRSHRRLGSTGTAPAEHPAGRHRRTSDGCREVSVETGLDGMWNDGICCTGVLVRDDPARVAQALGTAHRLAEGERVAGDVPEVAEPHAFVMRPVGSEWSMVELAWRSVDHCEETGDDYLVPLFEEAIGVLRGRAPEARRLVYETPVSLAASLSRRLGAAAIAIWGSDEEPVLDGGAFFVDAGDLQLACSRCDAEKLERSLVSRRRMREAALRGDEEDADEAWDDEADDEDPDDEEHSWVFESGRQPTRRPVSVVEYLDTEFKRRGVAFHSEDLLQDLHRAAVERGAGAALEGVADLYVVSAPSTAAAG